MRLSRMILSLRSRGLARRGLRERHRRRDVWLDYADRENAMAHVKTWLVFCHGHPTDEDIKDGRLAVQTYHNSGKSWYDALQEFINSGCPHH